jgi:FAD/FMN-containing dehydrogenase
MQPNPAAVQRFKASLHGTLLGPCDAAYEHARRVWNGRIDRYPAVIAYCTDVTDVMHAIQFGRSEQLPVAVRSGGHSVSGHGVCDGGLVIDVSRMKSVRVDLEQRMVYAQPGLTNSELLRATQPFGLATPTSGASDVGLSGLTLGGGLGWLTSLYGLACDNLLTVDIVTADGRQLTASATTYPDLFWAVHGGGGNFGVVTTLQLQLHPVAQVLAGIVIHPMARAREVLQFYRAYTQHCPDALTVDVAMITAPDGRPVIGLVAACCSPLAQAEHILAPLRAFGPPLADLIRPMTILEANALPDPFSRPGRNYAFKAYALPSLSEEAIDTIIRHSATRPSAFSPIVLRHVHGAATRVAPDATAIALRSEQYILEIIAQWTEGAAAPHLDWAHEFWADIEPFADEGMYANLLGDADEVRVRASYGANYAQLVRVKNMYDPTNFFRLNQNIRPTAP